MANRVRTGAIATLISAALSFSLISPAVADDDRSKSKPSAKMVFKNAKEKLKYEIDLYKSAMQARQEAREEINEVFKNSIRKATTEARIALMTATTAEQKLAIMNSLKNARSEAVAARDAALAALGALPTPPAELKKDEKKRN
jgi:ribosome maturation protein Sdo1